MVELYDNGNSVCAHKVRVALADKGLGVAAWYKRVLARASVKRQNLDRMTPEDHAPFKALS